MEIKNIVENLGSDNLENIKSTLEKIAKTIGNNNTLIDSIHTLDKCIRYRDNYEQLQYDNLRDYLITLLIDTLIEKEILTKEDYTLNVLGKLSIEELSNLMHELGIALNKQYDPVNIGKFFENNEKQLYRHQVHNYGDGDDDDDNEEDKQAQYQSNIIYLQKFIQIAIEKWGADTNIDDIKNKLESIVESPKLRDIEYSWHYCTRCDDYDNYDRDGDISDILEKIYDIDSYNLHEYSIEELYEYADCPDDRYGGYEFEYSNVERDSDIPSLENFLILLWADIIR
jgi:hypothetical protein